MVILDNGHGRNTSGKRSPEGLLAPKGHVALYEFEFNRDIVRRIHKLLTAAEIPTSILVPEYEDVPLHERVLRANKIHQQYPHAFGISIHANAFNGNAEGFEAFTFIGQSESDVIAEYILKEAQRTLPFRMRFDRSDGDLDKESRFYILRNTSCPFVLTESVFMDNDTHLAYMLTDQGRQEIAMAHYRGISNYLNC